MKKNMGNTDKIARLILAAVFLLLVSTATVNGVLSYILIIFAGIFALTSVIGFCPLYLILGINTCALKDKTEN
jgi:hypothetical protein